MSRSSTLILLGVLVILAPFSGLPIAIRNLLAVIFGAIVVGIGIWLRSLDVRALAAATAPEAPIARNEEPSVVADSAPQEPPHEMSAI